MYDVPALRFPEFSGEWKKLRLSDFATKITKKNKGNIVKNVLCNSANLGLVPQGNYFDREIANTENTDGYYVICNGDFVYNPRKSTAAPFGPVNIYEGEDAGIISPLYLCFSVHNIFPKFLYYRFKSSAWHSYVYSHGDSGVRFDRVSIKDDVFFDMPIYKPAQDEQIKIATLLQLIDDRISTQNKIIEDLKKLMSAISLLLFSECFANDKLVPLKSISNSIKRKNDGQIHPIMMISAEHGFINQSEKYDKDNAGNSLSNYTLLYKGELSYNRGSSKSKKFGSVFSLLIQSALVPHVYHSFCMDESVADCTFYSLLLNSRLLDKELVKVVSSTARMDGLLNISKEDFFSIKVPLPCIDKQRSITNILQKINIKIKREKNIQSLLCLQRKYLLSQMFI